MLTGDKKKKKGGWGRVKERKEEKKQQKLGRGGARSSHLDTEEKKNRSQLLTVKG